MLLLLFCLLLTHVAFQIGLNQIKSGANASTQEEIARCHISGCVGSWTISKEISARVWLARTKGARGPQESLVLHASQIGMQNKTSPGLQYLDLALATRHD